MSTMCQRCAGPLGEESDEDSVHTAEGHRACPVKSKRITALSNDFFDQFEDQVLVLISLNSI